MHNSLRKRAWIAAFASLVLVQAATFAVYSRDQRYLTLLMDSIVSHDATPSAQAKAVVAFLRDKSDRENPKYLFLPIFGFLRATPRQVAEYGGWCSDRSRLLVVLLQLRGINASKWALYSPKDNPKHAVVEVDSEGGKMVVDPLFGLWFPEPNGGYYSIEEMRGHPEILRGRINELIAQGVDPGSEPLKEYPLNVYIYANARTINWDKNLAFKALYKFFYLLIGPAVDDLPRPGWAEQPALMLIWATFPLEALLLAAWIFQAYRRTKRRLSFLGPSQERSRNEFAETPDPTDGYLQRQADAP